jgi:serine/threonine protein phosphatase PrpC
VVGVTAFTTAAAAPRARSEDRAVVWAVGDAWIVVVADGTGGAVGGAAAAEHVIAGVERAIGDGLAVAAAAAWVATLEAIDRAIAGDPRAGETTAIALAVVAGQVVGASCGDSRAWLDDGERRELTGGQVCKPRLGSGAARAVGFTAAARGRLVVATDGVWDYLTIDDALAAAGGGAASVIAAVAARFRTFPDDIAVVVGELG